MANPTTATTAKKRVISGLLILCFYIVIGLELFFTDTFIAVRYLHFSYLAFFLLAVILFLFFLMKRSQLTPLLIPALLFISWQYFAPLFSANGVAHAGTSMQHNSLRFLSFSINSRNDEYDKVAALLAKQPADVVCLQEVPYSRYQKLLASLQNAGVDYHHVYSRKQSLMIMATAPLQPHKTMPYLQASVQLADRKMKIWNLHSPKSLRQRHYQDYYFKKLQLDLAGDNSEYKLVCGDFNATPHNDIVKAFDSTFQAAYRSSPHLVNFSYPTVQGFVPSPFPFLKIDYLFFTPNFTIDHYERLSQYAHSDHYPIMATVRFHN